MAKKAKKDGEALAKAKAAKAVKPKKSKKAKKDKPVEKAKKVRIAEPMDAPKDKKGKKKDDRLESIASLVDHPLVADLVAAGAVAAVGALAEKKVTSARGTSSGSKAALKLAGAAAASAIGKRLMAEFEEAKKRREDNDEE
ncbi:hypothetical protein [Sphingomicrobium flavum]|uniref:hypothetical protein n=1 Tax=Sphingomicrobium flavum TaxID=1229164 RepID=UPI0021ADA3D0|nr:hypothetical protein [Sphingomicrobium flavum]